MGAGQAPISTPASRALRIAASSGGRSAAGIQLRRVIARRNASGDMVSGCAVCSSAAAAPFRTEESSSSSISGTASRNTACGDSASSVAMKPRNIAGNIAPAFCSE